MAITKFIPELWSAEMLLSFHETAVAANLVNREYEGLATKGNTVHITSAVDVTIKNYKTGVGGNPRTTAADPVSDAGLDLLIDQEKSFDFYVDDIDKAQAAGSMDAYTKSAATGLAEDADKFILALAAAGDATPLGGTAADGNAAFDVVRDLRKRLSKRHVPQGQRTLLVNAEFESLLIGADSKLTSFDTSGTAEGLREAIIGRLLGFTVVTTENLPKTTNPFAVALWNPAVAFVSQVEETEGLRAQDKFADRLRGLHVYGGKVIRPEGVAVYDATVAG